MKHVQLILLALATLFVGSAPCFAQTQCPWMNAATAGGFLGGDVQMAVTGFTADGDATCQFTRGGTLLRIAVHTMPDISKEFPGYLAQCGTKAVSLKGIGNLAVQCFNKSEELIVGRVRERAFVITIKAQWAAQPPTTPTKTRNPISDDSENIAEQVTGSMF